MTKPKPGSNRKAIIWSCVALVAIAALFVWIVFPKFVQNRELVKALQEKECPKFAKLLKTLLNTTPLPELANHRNPSVVLAHRWNIIRHSPHSGQRELADFFGACRNATNAELPDWWMTAFGMDWQHGVLETGELFEIQHPESGITIAKGTQSDDAVKITVKETGRSFQLPPRFSGDLAFCQSEVAIFVGRVSTFDGPFEIARFDKANTSEAKWTQAVWGVGVVVLVEGIAAFNVVEMELKGDLVIVYGIGGFSDYIEAFDAKSGRAVFRFATSYSNREYREHF